jgi:uncharacterized membrane protein
VAIGIFQDKFKRPRVRPERTWFDHLLDFLVLDLVLVNIGYALWWYPSLPTTIPTKFGSGGQVIATGPPETVLLLPLGALVLATIMRLVQRWPWISNTIVAITEENALVQYRLVNRLLGWSSLVVGVLFLVIEHQIIESAMTGTNPGQAGFVTILVLALVPWPLLLGWYLWSSVKHA